MQTSCPLAYRRVQMNFLTDGTNNFKRKRKDKEKRKKK